MKKLDKTERRIELLKILQGEKWGIKRLVDHFDVDERTIRSDLNELRDGMSFFGTMIEIETSHPGSQKRYFKSTVHPIVLALNLSELFMLLKVLEENSKEASGEVYRYILERIYGQMTDYAEDRIAPRLKSKYSRSENVNILEEDAFKTNKADQIAYWYKSGRYIEISYLDEAKQLVSIEARLLSMKDNDLHIIRKDGISQRMDYSEIIIDWSAIDYE